MNKSIITLCVLSVLLGGTALKAGAQDVTFTSDSLSLSTVAVSTADGASLYKVPASNITNTLPGLLNGLTVIMGNGVPGEDIAGLYVRGIGTYGMNGVSNTAKIYVDGFETNKTFLSYLSPSEIKSVSILKDAASLAAFGMNGAEGVIWIETNRGKDGPLQVSFQARSGMQNPINVPKALGTKDFTKLYNHAISNDANTGDLDFYYDDEYQGPNVDWWDEAMRKYGLYTDTDLSVRGGTGNINYNVVLGYANQQGLFNVQNTDNTSNATFSRYSVRAAIDVKLTKAITASVDMAGRVQDKFRPNYGIGDLMNNIAAYPANIYPVYDEAVTEGIDNFSGTTVYPDNPVASIKGLGWIKDHTRIIQSNFKFKEDLKTLLPGLFLEQGVSFYVNSTGRYSKTRNYARFFNGTEQTTDMNTSMTASAFQARNMEQWIQGYVLAGYNNTFGKNRISGNAGFRISSYMGEGRFQYKNHYLNQTGNLTYAYDNRYVAAFTWSLFGSDAFAEGNKWHFYPTASAAWIISNEDFLKGSDAVDLLKLRASAGFTGYASSAATSAMDGAYNSSGRYLYEQYYTSSQAGSFYIGSSAPFSSQGTLAPLFIANKNVGPEKSLKFDVGIDARLLKGLDITVDAFMDKRSDILTLDESIMQYYGNIVQFNNVGKMTNMGAELSVCYSSDAGPVKYSVFASAAYIKNKIDYMAEKPTMHDYNAKTGRPFGARIGLKCIGFYDINDFDDEGNLNENIPAPMFGHVQPGDLRYEDLDKNGQVDQNDVTMVGNPFYPMLTASMGGAVSFKGIDFNFLLTGAYGGTIDLMEYPTYTRAFVDNGNAFPIAKNAWAFYPDAGVDTRKKADYPRLTTNENANNYRTSSFWIKDNNYIRVKSIELGYDISSVLPSDAKLTKARIYVNAMNPFTLSSVLSKYQMDPECGYGYPALKSYNLGVQLSF